MCDSIQNKVTAHEKERTDREKLPAKLEKRIDPFDTKSHSREIVNISSDAVTHQ